MPPKSKPKAKPKEEVQRIEKPVCSGIYFDNNGTTLMCPEAKASFMSWASCHNPSSDSRLSLPIKQLLDVSRQKVLQHCKVQETEYSVIFTSGGTESNSTSIISVVLAYKKRLGEMRNAPAPHIVTSMIEHHSVLETLHMLEKYMGIRVTYLKPTHQGIILASQVEKAITPETCLVTIMFANNELGTINNLQEIVKVAHKHRVPVHSDCVQVFGKYGLNLAENGIDMISASAHKFYGPKGMGVLVIRNSLVTGYDLPAIICGTQQNGLRGGTENVAGIVSTVVALRYSMSMRKDKNAKLLALRQQLIEGLKTLFPLGQYEDYISAKPHNPIEFVILGSDKPGRFLPNTVMFAVAKNTGAPFCNVKLKKFLDENKIIVSIGSACMTSSPDASHVIKAIDAPSVIKRGVLRISFGDSNTSAEVTKFLSVLAKGIKDQAKMDLVEI